MNKSTVTLSILVVGICISACKGPEGPIGPSGTSGTESLTDPNVQPRVVFTNPLSNSTGPYADFTSQFTVRFNKIMDRSSFRRSLSISAPHGDVFIDSNGVRTTGGDVFMFSAIDSQFRVYSTTRWRVAEVYTMNISSNAVDVNGNLLKQPFSLTFTPEPSFRVVSFSPPDGSSDIYVGTGVAITFNSPVDPSSLSSIRISPPMSGVWIFTYYSDSTSITYSLANRLDMDTIYTITIDTTFHDKYGNHLPQQFSSHFHTEQFNISSAYPSTGETNVGRNQPLYFYCNADIDTLTLPTAFNISPPVAGRFQQGYYSFTFTPDSLFQPNTIYNITISTALASNSGKHLPLSYYLSFTTGN